MNTITTKRVKSRLPYKEEVTLLDGTRAELVDWGAWGVSDGPLISVEYSICDAVILHGKTRAALAHIYNTTWKKIPGAFGMVRAMRDALADDGQLALMVIGGCAVRDGEWAPLNDIVKPAQTTVVAYGIDLRNVTVCPAKREVVVDLVRKNVSHTYTI